MVAEQDPQVVVINATIYAWQKDALRQYQERLNVLSLSEALRSALTGFFTIAGVLAGTTQEQEQPA